MLHKSFLTIRLISFPLIPEVVNFNKENKHSEIQILLIHSFPYTKSYSAFAGGGGLGGWGCVCVFFDVGPLLSPLSELPPLPESLSQMN